MIGHAGAHEGLPYIGAQDGRHAHEKSYFAKSSEMCGRSRNRLR